MSDSFKLILDHLVSELDNYIIIVYLFVMIGAGLLASRKVDSFKEYALSDCSYGAFVIFATLSASFIGGGFSTGNASKVFLFGIGNIICLWGFSFKELLVARYIVPRIGRFEGALSTGDIMGQTYGKSAQIITGVFSVILCAGIMGAQVGAMGYVFNVFMGMDKFYGILIGCGIAIFYSTFGGIRAVVATDVIQFVILAIGLPLVLILGVVHIGGVSELFSGLPEGHLSYMPSNLSIVSFISLFLTLLLGETLVPPYVQRLLIGRDLNSTAKGTFWSGIFSFPFFAVTGLIGLLAFKIDPKMTSDLAMPNVIKTVLPVGLCGLVVAGVISIVMSSADSFLNSAAVGFTNDVYKKIISREMKLKNDLFCARLVTVITGVLAILFAVSIPNILDILLAAYNFWAPVILVPLAAAIFGFKAGAKSFWTGIICGAIGIITWKYVFKDYGGFDGMIVGVATNLAGFYIMSRLESRPEAVTTATGRRKNA